MFRVKCGCGVHASYRSQTEMHREGEWGHSQRSGICEECYRALPPDHKGQYVRRNLTLFGRST